MLKKLLFIGFVLLGIGGKMFAQELPQITVSFLKKEIEILPGEVINLPVSVENLSDSTVDLLLELQTPDGWKVISNKHSIKIVTKKSSLVIFSVQSAMSESVGSFPISVHVSLKSSGKSFSSVETSIKINEYENISMFLVEAPKHVLAGEVYRAKYLVQNQGNTTKRLYIESSKCIIEGGGDVVLAPKTSAEIIAYVETNEELLETSKDNISIKAVAGSKVYDTKYLNYIVFPKIGYKKDLYFRYPIKASANYLYSNQYEEPISGYQLELSGAGPLDVEGKHYLEFLARGPDNHRFGFMGMYDQYYITYKNNNMDITVGERSYQFTQLTESSRYGFGAESRFKLNNGIKFGAIYVQPRFYEEIKNELAGNVGYEFNKNNWLDLFYIAKNTHYSPDLIHLASISGRFMPFEKTNVEFEYSQGQIEKEWDHAYRAAIHSRVSIFLFGANYSYSGESYPGYFNNSKFYSVNFSAQVSKKLQLGVFAKEDFQNAQLDTFFINAPYSKSINFSANYDVFRQAKFRLFWREYERKDRLDADKFHYKTNSINANFRHTIRSFNYDVLGEIGETKDFLAGELNNTEQTYRLSANASFQIADKHTFRAFGSWSNVNSFITNEQRNLTVGIAAQSKITKNLEAMLYVQNAYDIDEYYQNRNLMQFNLDYRFLKNHKLSVHSYYTLFKTTTEDPYLTLSAGYSYEFGVPLKQVIEAGDLKGIVHYSDGTPVRNLVLTFANKTALTNEHGEYLFNTVAPGRHLLFVDKTNFKLDEICNIPVPAEIEILGNELSEFNIVITNGARVAGQMLVEDKPFSEIMIVELKSVFDQFRITTNNDGTFAFPMVRPGNYTLKVYENGLPNGYTLKKSMYQLDLKSAQEVNLKVEISKRKRNIIFKSQNFVLTPQGELGNKNSERLVDSTDVSNNGMYYSVQIGAFAQKRSAQSNYFRDHPFEMELQSKGMYKYFIGKFTNINDAQELRDKLSKHYHNPFVVEIKDGEIKPAYK